MFHFYVFGTGASKGGSGRRDAARRPGRPDPAAGGAASGPARGSPAVACARTCTPQSQSALVSSYTYPSCLVACARLDFKAPTKLARGEAATRGLTACPLLRLLQLSHCPMSRRSHMLVKKCCVGLPHWTLT